MISQSELKVEAMRAANAAIGTARSFNQNPQPIDPATVLNHAKSIYAWFVETEGEKRADPT